MRKYGKTSSRLCVRCEAGFSANLTRLWSMSGKRNRVFLDSSVLYAAVLSLKGGSCRVLREASHNNLLLFITSYVIAEVEISLSVKYPSYTPRFRAYLQEFPVALTRTPSAVEVARWINAVPPKDAPLLAGAANARATHFLTLDKKHFLNNPTLLRMRLPFEILTPGEFLQKFMRPR